MRKKINSNFNKPLVSVIMPIHNGSCFMREALDSIFFQTYKKTEVLAIDDASTDNTWSILQNYKKKYPRKIKLFRLKKNVGAFTAANIAFPHTKGEYIAPMDSDDISHEERIEKEVEFLNKNSDVLLVSSCSYIIDENGIVTGEKKYATDNDKIYKSFATIHPIVHPACMIRKKMLPDKQRLYYTNFGVNSDYYTLFSLLQYGKFSNIPEKLLSYRIHGKNSSLQDLKEKFYNINKIRIAAVKNFNYRFPLTSIPIVFLQYVLVSLVPASFLLPLYLTIRGMKTISLPEVKFNLDYAKRVLYVPIAVLLFFTRIIKLPFNN